MVHAADVAACAASAASAGAKHQCDRTMRARVPKTIVTREFKSFQRNYLYVYVCALGAEWLQDSHLFALLLRHGHGVDQVGGDTRTDKCSRECF